MRRFGYREIVLIALFYVFGATGLCFADVVINAQRKIKTKGTPIATAVATGGKTVFVLMEGGSIEIYTDKGILKGTMQVSPSATHIATSWRGDKLYVTDKAERSLEIFDLDFIVKFDTEGSPSIGPEKAPITIVEFSDFECPYCSRLAPVMHKILKEYPDDIRLVFKNYPLTKTHKMAMMAASAALAAHEQGRFWEFHDKLFENHKQLSEQKILDIAREVGLDMEKFELARRSPDLFGLINRDIKEARENNLKGVPTLFINGHKIVGTSMASLKNAIRRELKKIADKKN